MCLLSVVTISINWLRLALPVCTSVQFTFIVQSTGQPEILFSTANRFTREKMEKEIHINAWVPVKCLLSRNEYGGCEGSTRLSLNATLCSSSVHIYWIGNHPKPKCKNEGPAREQEDWVHTVANSLGCRLGNINGIVMDRRSGQHAWATSLAYHLHNGDAGVA